MKNTIFITFFIISLLILILNFIEINKEKEIFMEFYQKNKNIDKVVQALDDKLNNVILNLMD